MLGMQWRIQGRGWGGGGGLPPLFSDQTEAQRAEKNFLHTGPLLLISGSGFSHQTPPPHLRPYFKV